MILTTLRFLFFFSVTESVKSEKKLILKDLLKLADTYGLKQLEVRNIHIAH